MAYRMLFNKDKFFKTEFGAEMDACIMAWDKYLTQNDRAAARICQYQWDVYKLAMKQFYSIDCIFSRTDDYYGIVGVLPDGKEEMLTLHIRKEQQYYKVCLDSPTCVAGPFTAAEMLADREPGFCYYTADQYKSRWGMEVKDQL